jgi:predicted amidohydrolase
MNLAWHDPQANLAHAEALIAQAPPQTHLILLPEMFTTGFSMEAAALAETPDGPAIQWMRRQSATTGAVIAGSVVFREGDRMSNRFIAVDANGVVCHYDKRHLFRMAKEHETYSQGEQQVTFTLRGWRIRPLVCYDLRFPVWSRNTLPDGPLATDLMLYVANWPAPRVAHWKLLLQARAVENQCCVAGVNRVGTDGKGIAYTGDSMIVDALGNVLQHAEGKEAVLSHTLDPDALSSYRERFPAWRDADSFSL